MLHNIYLGLCRLIQKNKTKQKKITFVEWKWNWTLFFNSQLDLNFLKNKQELKV
jgi:hypothetical protein